MPAQDVLVIDDEPNIIGVLTAALSEIGLRVTPAKNARDGLQKARAGTYSLVILDVGLPDQDGFSVCKELRRLHARLPILMLTCRTSEVDKVLGLELGADDYVAKPFSSRELTARVKALLRRSAPEPEQIGAEAAKTIEVGELIIDLTRRRVSRGSQDVTLTATEFDLLSFLATHPGRPFSREQLLTSIWGYRGGEYEYTVNTHMNRLRSKVERDPASPVYLLTVWGIGYRFVEAHELKDDRPHKANE